MFVPQNSLNGRHLKISLCRVRIKIKWCRLEEEEAWEGTEKSLTTYGVPLYQFTSFKYLRLVLVAEYDDWPSVVRNLRHSRQKWVLITWLLRRKGADNRTL